LQKKIYCIEKPHKKNENIKKTNIERLGEAPGDNGGRRSPLEIVELELEERDVEVVEEEGIWMDHGILKETGVGIPVAKNA
jgi:hypothetical protein